MDSDWKDWDVVEDTCRMKVPGFMLWGAENHREEAQRRIRDEWEEFVGLLNTNGCGTGYERLLTLRDNMEARKGEFAKEVEKWEDREDWLGKLKGRYHLKLQDLAGIEKPFAIWKTRSVTDLVEEQLPDATTPLADQPIVESFVEFGGDGRLEEWPDLEDGWSLSTGAILQGPGDIANVLQGFGYTPEDVDARRENTTVRYRHSERQLERAGIDPDNLDSPRMAIDMGPSTTWREALLQIEEEEQAVREKKSRPRRTVRVLDFRLRIAENVIHRFETFGSVEFLTEEEAQEAARKAAQAEEPPITGYYGAEYATEARDVLKETPSITSFSGLNREMGESKVDTVKRNIGYDDLPRETKEEEGFSRFKRMLKEKVEQLYDPDLKSPQNHLRIVSESDNGHPSRRV